MMGTTESPALKALLQSLMHPGLKTIDLSLGRMERYLAANGHPEKQLPPVIHVAGTNGKGSTIAFLRAIAEAAGYRCHQFTSPHLVHFRERMVVAGQMLEEPELINSLTIIQQKTKANPLTFFEANTALAFELFAERSADIVLLEVGMGGRFDATNVIEKPAITVITPVSMDHQAYLGDTLAKIAYEKAGIIKPGVPVVVAPQAPQAYEVIAQVAAEKNAPLIDVCVQPHAPLGLQGAHQQMNASTAVTVSRWLQGHGFDALTEDVVRTGLAKAHWPGRLQPLSRGSLVELRKGSAPLWLDGGHNEQAGQLLAEWAKAQGKPVTLICAMSEQKDPHAFLRAFVGVVAQVMVVDIPDEPLMMKPELLIQAAKTLRFAVSHHASVEEAVAQLDDAQIGLIAGSLYLAGFVLQKNS